VYISYRSESMPKNMLPNIIPIMTKDCERLDKNLRSQTRSHSVTMVVLKVLVSNSLSLQSLLHASVTFSVLLVRFRSRREVSLFVYFWRYERYL